MKNKKPQILITGATGQIGGATLRLLQSQAEIEPVAAVRSPAKAAPFEKLGIRTVQLDFDREETLAPALAGIERVFLATGYTVDMLRQSKVFLDRARQAGVRHVVHLGACGRDDTSVAHWAWHQLIERYIEWSGFSFTHLRRTGGEKRRDLAIYRRCAVQLGGRRRCSAGGGAGAAAPRAARRPNLPHGL